MRQPEPHTLASTSVYRTFLLQLVYNYVFGSAIAVLGVGGVIIFSTLKLPEGEVLMLGVILMISLLIMLTCELFVFYRHAKPIQDAFLTESPTAEQLCKAYIQTHRFPVLSLLRTFGPHLLGMSVPAIAMSYIFIKQGWLTLPYYYIGLACIGALLVASMHAMIEFFLTSRAIRPLVTYVRNKHISLYGQDLTLGGQVFTSIRTKFLLSAFLIGTLPLLLYSLAAQIRLEGLNSVSTAAYWQWAGIIIVIGVSFSLFCASLLSRNIEDPINTLQAAMSAVQNGHYGTRAEDIYSDEFSKLVAGFNHMIEGLKERDDRNKQLLQSYFFTLAAALDARDAYTAGHSMRVAEYSVTIGTLAGWQQSEIDLLRKSALLHDIGKIGIRDAVLLKDGKLTDEEFDQIKAHPGLGENILKQIEPADAMADLLPGVRSHHERYDGLGYPDGLAGEQIPLLGRVIAIADAYDAMTSDRPYRKGMTRERAMAILQEGKGTQWDPALTELFLQSLRHSD